jgi:GNAT superfamily N-acetyltransferase
MIVPVETGAHLGQVRMLFEEYWASFGFTPCFQNFSAELASLPGAYAPPGGRLALARIDGEPAGCAALKPFDDHRCEFKRLYVRPAFRGAGLGQTLLDWLIAEARAAGYREVLGDTMPVMQGALRMYDRMGFERTGPYAVDPTPGAIFLRLRL